MRAVLKNLSEGKRPEEGLMGIGSSLAPIKANSAATVLSALRKRGLVRMMNDASYAITQQGLDALAQAERNTQ